MREGGRAVRKEEQDTDLAVRHAVSLRCCSWVEVQVWRWAVMSGLE